MVWYPGVAEGAPQKRKGIGEALKRARTGRLRKPVQCLPRDVNSGRVAFSCPAERYAKRCTKLTVDAVFRVTRCKQLAQPARGRLQRVGASAAPGTAATFCVRALPAPMWLRLRCLKLRPLAEQLLPSSHPHSEPRMSWVCGALELTFESDWRWVEGQETKSREEWLKNWGV